MSASPRGVDPEDLEEVPGYERALRLPAIDPAVDVRNREGIGEDARLADERFVLRAREGLGLGVGRPLTLDREQLVRVAHLVHAKDHRVEDVKTTATRPRPSPTVVTIVRATKGARRNDRQA